MVGCLLPVVSVLLGAVVLGEDLSVRVVLGMAVVLVGVGMPRRQGAAALPRLRRRATQRPGPSGSFVALRSGRAGRR